MAGFVVDGMERTASLTFSVVVASVCCLFAALVFAGCASEPAAPKLTPEEMIEQKDAWADGVVRSALDKLADEGAIGKVSKTADLLVDAFEYEKIDNGYGIAFKDKALGKELSGAYTLPNGKVILCRTRTTGAKEAPFMTVYPEYADGDWVNEAVGEDVPLFYPESLNGHFDEERSKIILADVPAEAFADSFDDCDFLIVYDEVASHVDENYYFGSINRTSVTTLVLVVDMKSGQVVHIENVGTDTPGSTVKMGQQHGTLLWDEVAAYLNKLLTNRSKS